MDGLPDSAVAVVAGDVQAIDDGHAQGQVAGGLDVDKMLAVASDDCGVESNRHGDGVR